MTQQKQQHFSIGQIVYILSNQGQSIVPAIVVEEKTIQTLQGTNVSWKIAVGPSSKQKIVESTNITGEIYTNLEEIKQLLIKKLNDFVNQAVSVARQRENDWYGKLKSENKNNSKNTNQPNSQLPPKNSKIDLESLIDGMDNSSSEDSEENNNNGNLFSSKLVQLTEEEKVSAVKNQLKNSIMPSREELQRDVEFYKEEESFVLQGPDGKPIVAKMNI